MHSRKYSTTIAGAIVTDVDLHSALGITNVSVLIDFGRTCEPVNSLSSVAKNFQSE